MIYKPFMFKLFMGETVSITFKCNSPQH